MIEITTLEIGGFSAAMQALRLPHSLPPRSDTSFNIEVIEGGSGNGAVKYGGYAAIHAKDLELADRLIRADDCEAKAMRGILVWTKISAPMDWWCELETYRAGHERLSSSSKMHGIYKGLTGDDLDAARDSTPATFPLTKIDYFSYQCLKNIYIWRRHHRIREWREFCAWIESLPYAKELILTGKGE